MADGKVLGRRWELVNTEGDVNVQTESVRGIRESLFFCTAGDAGMGVLLLGTMGAGHKKAKARYTDQVNMD